MRKVLCTDKHIRSIDAVTQHIQHIYQRRWENVMRAGNASWVAGVWRASYTTVSSFFRLSLLADVNSDIVVGCLEHKECFKVSELWHVTMYLWRMVDRKARL